MRFLLVSLLVLGASAYPADFTLTVDMLNKMIEKLKTESQYVPSYVMDQINNATDAEKQQFVDLMNRIHKGQFPPVSSTQQFVETVEKEAPLIGPKARAIYENYLQRYNNLTPEAKQFISTLTRPERSNLLAFLTYSLCVKCKQVRTLGKQVVHSHAVIQYRSTSIFQEHDCNDQGSHHRHQGISALTIDGITPHFPVNPETWASLKQQFPEQVKAWEECPQFKALRAFMENLPKNSDLTKDPDTLNKIMELGFKKYLPAEATAA
ncbi:hypothetical protein Y032_0031g2391 [Ancylostoma ceylanicum]|uniref:Uncharacterized protein n=1 Tax=Ancylostoma ceylanicum TaxID=53326 RepID=A0A016UQV5_9BILA|nr:hypothetical protein Y032_0031g2391 [Ancylostoma ceylanicum]